MQNAQTFHASGGRKRASARAFIAPHAQATEIKVNRKPLDAFTLPFQQTVQAPLETLKSAEGYDANQGYNIALFVRGGGTTGQAQALQHALAKALLLLHDNNPAYKSLFKAPENKYTTRDDRIVQRKKYGKPKARKSKPWVKR